VFPASYFAPRMFAPRYWPKVGATILTEYVLFGDARDLSTPMLAVSLGPDLEYAEVATPLTAEALAPRTDA
jgi:hypothetical protein